MLSSLEICAGGGGQAIGLERAGFEHRALVELDQWACTTLRTNRPSWRVVETDVRQFSATPFRGIDLFAGGVPCPPFSVAGKQKGGDDSRDLFPDAIRLVDECKPRAVMLENVPGFAQERFKSYRAKLKAQLADLGYEVDWRIVQAADFGVPQLRPRFVLVALQRDLFENFTWPEPRAKRTTVGEALYGQMAASGWKGVDAWARKANNVGPTLVGGSKLHGGPDLGPTRAKLAWSALGVDGRGLANEAPSAEESITYTPKLTVRMAATIQGFPEEWHFSGGKTAAYRKVGNAFPPPVAFEVGSAIRKALEANSRGRTEDERAFLRKAG